MEDGKNRLMWRNQDAVNTWPALIGQQY